MKRTLLFVTLFAFVAGSAFFVARNVKRHISSGSKKTEREPGEKEGDKDGYQDALAYLANLRANKATGVMDPNDYYQAKADADYYRNHPVSRGGLNLQWDEMGPDNVGGRTRAILFDKQNPGWVFAGAVSGGLWFSQTNGSSWNKVSGYNSFGSLNISAIAQGEDGSIFVGTGEGFTTLTGNDPIAGAGGFPGNGIYRSTDHGQTWTQIETVNESGGLLNNAAFSFVNHLTSGGLMHPGYMYVAINGSNTSKGIEYWNDTTSTWNNVLGLPTSGVSGYDVEVGTNGIVHAIVGGKYYRSTDGRNFTGSTIPGTSGSNRIELSVSVADPNYIYAISSYEATQGTYGEIQGVFKSTDAGLTWTTIAPEGTPGSVDWEPVTQGGYALAIAAWPGDKDVVFIGGIDTYKGIPNADPSQGYNWYKMSNWTDNPSASSYVHADIHRFVFDPTNPNNMFVGCDGGLSYTTNANATYPTFGTRNLQYNVTQFYSCCGKPYTGEVLAGAQDNGSIYINFNGNTVQSGQLVNGGDGGDVAQSLKNPQAVFTSHIGGGVQRSSSNGQSFSSFFDFNIDCQPKNAAGNCAGDGLPDDFAPFIAPILLWENPIPDSTNSKFFLGTNTSIWMTPGALDFATGPTWFKLAKGTAGAFISLAVSPDGSTIYGGTDAGNLYRVTGINDTGLKYIKGVFNPDLAGIKTTLLRNFPQDVTGISVDVNNPGHIVCSLGNYGNTDYVYESNNADTGSTSTVVFTSIQGQGLPLMPAYSVIIDNTPGNSGNIILGTERGIYTTTNHGQQWSDGNVGSGIDPVPIFKLRSIPLGNQDNVIYASAYGRGVFRTRTLAFTGIKNVQPATVKGVNVYPNPASSEVFISMDLPLTGSTVQLTVLDITGRIVKTINEGKMGPGLQIAKIPTGDLANGTYIVNLRTDNGQANSKLIIMK